MTPDVRLAEVVSALEVVGVSCLVMGGHAVRFYGLCRHTNDVDLHVSPDQWDGLPARLARMNLFAGQPVIEGPSWRPGAFRRFQIGALPDGRAEWLELWRDNHLLAPYNELRTRAERGPYGQAAHVAHAADVHEVDLRLVEEEVVVQSGHFETGV